MLTERPANSSFTCGNTEWGSKIHPFGNPAMTLFIVDYDDTILASHWLVNQGLRLDSPVIPEEVTKELASLEARAIELLTTVGKLGKVALVTNAEHGWIELSARKFLPGIVPLLENVRILSARTKFENQFPGKTQMWKNEAYDLMFAEAFGAETPQAHTKYNVLSLGDSLYERSALLNLADKTSGMVGKSVKLIERPTVSQLQRQLEILVANMDTLASSEEPIDMMLTVDYIADC